MQDIIQIAERCGAYLSSRTRARLLRDDVVSRIESGSCEQVVLDFSGVQSLSDSFTDELLAVLVQERGKAWFRDHIRVESFPAEEREALSSVIASRISASVEPK